MSAYGEFEIGDRRYFTLARAAQVIGPSIVASTLLRWCRRGGTTPWGMDLDITRVPVVVHAKAYQPTEQRAQRFLITEDCTLLLKRLLCELDRPIRPSKFTRDELSELRTATKRLTPS